MGTATVLPQGHYNNATLTTIHLLKALNVKVTNSSIVEQLESHPHYPSLYSISDTLNTWKVETSAQQLDINEIEMLPVPFIAHTKQNGGEFLLVTAVNGAIEFINEAGKKDTKSTTTFLNEWTKVILLAKPTELSGEKNYWKKRIKETGAKYGMFLLTGVCLILFTIYNWQQVWVTGFLPVAVMSLKLTGSVVCSMLIWIEMGKNNPLLNKVCSFGGKGNCISVLSSGAATFLTIKWSEIGFVYFTGGALLLLFSNSVSSVIAIQPWISLFTPAFVIFSIVYQVFIIKQFCYLCLAVAGILLTETLLFLFGYDILNTSVLNSLQDLWLPLLCCFLLPALVLAGAKHYVIQSRQARLLRKEINKIKYNNDLFQSLLYKQKPVAFPGELGIQLGDPTASNQFIAVCNPYCAPCARGHIAMEELIHHYNANVRLLFTSRTNKTDLAANAIKLLMAIYKTDKNIISTALHDWFITYKMNYQQFAEKYKPAIEVTATEMQAMEQWCSEAEVSYTPCLFLNGYKIPTMYQITEIKYLLD